jgi:hypothetical protein
MTIQELAEQEKTKIKHYPSVREIEERAEANRIASIEKTKQRLIEKSKVIITESIKPLELPKITNEQKIINRRTNREKHKLKNREKKIQRLLRLKPTAGQIDCLKRLGCVDVFNNQLEAKNMIVKLQRLKRTANKFFPQRKKKVRLKGNDKNKPPTEKQIYFLKFQNIPIPKTGYEAWVIIGKIKSQERKLDKEFREINNV